MDRRDCLKLLPAGLLAGLGCAGGGRGVSILGYRLGPNYDTNYRTVHVPVFRSTILQTTPNRDFEMHLTRFTINAIEELSPYKVVADADRADTELLASVSFLDKTLRNRTPFNEVRQAELLMSCDVVWRDLETGRALTNGPRLTDQPLPGDLEPFDPSNPPPAADPGIARPARVSVSARMIPELGQSNVSMLDEVMKKMARQIAQLMEEPWSLRRQEVRPG